MGMMVNDVARMTFGVTANSACISLESALIPH